MIADWPLLPYSTAWWRAWWRMRRWCAAGSCTRRD